MTSLGAAVAVDSRGPAALYIITDSRIKFPNHASTWDAAQKTFASNRTADVFAYVGDAIFPPAILRQICEHIAAGLIFTSAANSELRHKEFARRFRASFRHYKGSVASNFSIFHGARDHEYMQSQFRLWELRYYPSAKRWEDTERPINEWKSCLIEINGSGREYIRKRVEDWERSEYRGTTRAAVWAFCDSLSSGADPFTGGAPQLVGIWRKGLPQHFGIVWKGNRYVAGLEIPKRSPANSVAWFNRLFERCDGESGKRLENAKKHKKPSK